MANRKTKSQKEKILAYLKDGLSLTRVEAFNKGFGLNLPARIQDLRKDGHKILDLPATDGSREKRYFIEGLYNAN